VTIPCSLAYRERLGVSWERRSTVGNTIPSAEGTGELTNALYTQQISFRRELTNMMNHYSNLKQHPVTLSFTASRKGGGVEV
jgi:hypothetical protein